MKVTGLMEQRTDKVYWHTLQVRNIQEIGVMIKKMVKVRYRIFVGVFEYANDDKYEGFWCNNKKHGKGFVFIER